MVDAKNIYAVENLESPLTLHLLISLVSCLAQSVLRERFQKECGVALKKEKILRCLQIGEIIKESAFEYLKPVPLHNLVRNTSKECFVYNVCP